MKFFVFVIICLALFLLVCCVLKFVSKKFKQAHELLHRWYFLVRFWLIGKYHCDIPPSYKKFWYLMNRAFWLAIFLCVAYTLFVGILGY